MYNDPDACFDAVKALSDAGVHQVNIHQVLSKETLDDCYSLLVKASGDERLKGSLKAVVFLTLKPKGPRNTHSIITDIAEYRQLINQANMLGVTLGMDSCSAGMYLRAMKDAPNFDRLSEMVESCESTLFSSYLNVDGEFFPCSFTEGEKGWETGLSVLHAKDFLQDIWYHPKTKQFREANLATTDKKVCGDCRSCVTFPVIDPANWGEQKKFIRVKEVAHV
jgi:radical SAM protein with 4Fe4S-binding SPASM domain